MPIISYKNIVIILALILSFVVPYKFEYPSSVIVSTMFITHFVTSFVIFMINLVWEILLMENYDDTIEWALKDGNIYNLELILKNSTNPIFNPRSMPLVFLTVDSTRTTEEKKLEMLKILLNYGDDLSKLYGKKNILDYVDKYDFEIIKFILEHPSFKTDFIKKKYKQVFDKIFNKTCDCTCEYRLKYFKKLIKNGFDKEHLGVNKENLLMLTCKKIWNDDILDMVLTLNFDVNAKDGSGFTALYYACLTNKLDFVQKLIKHGCNLNLYDKNNFTVLDWATEYSDYEIKKLLLDNGAKRFKDLFL